MNDVEKGVVSLQDAGGPAKCPECGCEEFEMRDYSPLWHEGDIHCAQCGGFMHHFDAG